MSKDKKPTNEVLFEAKKLDFSCVMELSNLLNKMTKEHEEPEDKNALQNIPVRLVIPSGFPKHLFNAMEDMMKN